MTCIGTIPGPNPAQFSSRRKTPTAGNIMPKPVMKSSRELAQLVIKQRGLDRGFAFAKMCALCRPPKLWTEPLNQQRIMLWANSWL